MITEEQIKELGWKDSEWIRTRFGPEGNENVKLYEIGDYQNGDGFRLSRLSIPKKRIEIKTSFKGYGKYPDNITVFSGKLISDNPKEELETIMKQIGII